MHLLRLIGAAIAAAVLAAPAHAQQAGITYDCDTAADHFSELELPAPAGHFVVSGEIRMQAIARISKFVPVGRIHISSATAAPGQAPDASAGFALTGIPAKALKIKGKDDNAVVQFLSWDERSGGLTKEHDPFGPAEYSDSLPFTIAFNGSTVTVRVGGKEQQFALAAAKPVVRVVCSTGEFLFTNLKIEPTP
jgi:hypothetical protein